MSEILFNISQEKEILIVMFANLTAKVGVTAILQYEGLFMTTIFGTSDEALT